jgi:hypothetical protein
VGTDSLTVESKFGNVQVMVDEDTAINKPPEQDVGLDAISAGDRVAILFKKEASPPSDDVEDDEGSDDSEEDSEEGSVEPQDSESGDTGENSDAVSDDNDADVSASNGDQTSDSEPSDDGEDSEETLVAEPSSEADGEENAEPSEGQDSEDPENATQSSTDSSDNDSGESDNDDVSQADDDADAEPFRTAVAQRITVIPGKPSRSHVRGVVVKTGRALGILKHNGELESVDMEDDDEAVEEGEEVVVVLRRHGHGKPAVLRNIHRARQAVQHLDELISRAESNGREEAVERLEELKERVQQRREEKLNEVLDTVPEEARPAVEIAIQRAREEHLNGRGNQDPSSTPPPQGSPGRGGGQGR